MANRVSIAVCLTLSVAFIVGAGCSSIPDHRKTLSDVDGGGGGAGNNPDGGSTGGSSGTEAGGTSGNGTGATGTGATGTGANGGAGGKGGTGANGGAGGKGGTGPGGSGGAIISIDGGDGGGIVGIPCGKDVCPDRAVGRVTLTACCAGPKKDHCGLDTTDQGYAHCIEYEQPGVVDTVCKDVFDPDDNGFTGCCRPDGKCGAFFSLTVGPNFGCVDPQDLGASAGKDCTPAACTAAGKACQNSSECCAGPAGDPVCVTLSNGGATCSDYCTNNGDCDSGCCILLVSGRGACGAASQCSTGLRKIDETCDVDTDCGNGAVCAPNSDFGPRLCEVKCTSNATCAPEFCVKDEAGRGACSSAGTGLCSDTCSKKSNGSCDDSGDGNSFPDCTLGTDCSDCGGATTKFGRIGGTSLCTNSCATNTNGKCEDGGPNAVAGTCAFGTDCADCKTRLGICLDTCSDAYDGTCDDGGPNSSDDVCGLGTDCFDCGIRFGGRGQSLCDGSTGVFCTPQGGDDEFAIDDGTCQCPDCPWDATDCKVAASKCDGRALGACCAPNNPCKLQFDGVCSCGGWCDWETPDCGPSFPVPKCDTSISDGCDFTSPDLTLQKNGKCDCQGACSWETDCTAVKTICKDTCKSANDFTCDDDDVVCPYGTDCADCGPRYPH
jgi:hypothetical protein